MAVEIKLPDLGEGVDSGDVLEVLVAEGDTIEQEQGIVELDRNPILAIPYCRDWGNVDSESDLRIHQLDS